MKIFGIESKPNKVPINPDNIHEGALPTAKEAGAINEVQQIADFKMQIAAEESSLRPDIEKIQFLRTKLYNLRNPVGKS